MSSQTQDILTRLKKHGWVDMHAARVDKRESGRMPLAEWKRRNNVQ